MSLNVYKGWHVWADCAAPVTGRYKASRHGVGMCAGTYEALVRMIDQKAKASHPWRRPSEVQS